jgi:hypothetical protein
MSASSPLERWISLESVDSALLQHCRSSLGRELPPELHGPLATLSGEIVARHGATSAATLVYGSCLWRGQLEGVADLFLVVDDYRSAFASRRAAAWNRRLPPNVFPLFDSDRDETVRAKYGVLSLEHLRRCSRLECPHCFVWARLCQPAALVFARDHRVREAVTRAAARSVLSTVALGLALHADREGCLSADTGVWTTAFDATYRAEWRFEARERTAEIVAAEVAYYEGALAAALGCLAHARAVELRGNRVHLDPHFCREVLRIWKLRARTSKILAGCRLVKNAFVFGDWVPYALWKMERHTGVRLQASPAQRRHPFLFGWPLLFQVLRRRLLR